MGEFELPLGVFAEHLRCRGEARDAQNGGQRIVEFVRDAGEHLAHSGKLLG